ncbi:MAG: Rieske (2Fe-2S) protein [Acidimicrobiales bacterium]
MNNQSNPDPLTWHKILASDELPDGRVKTVTAGNHNLAVSRVGDAYGALDNRCPHQGGPLGEGTIEVPGCVARGTGTTTTRSRGSRRAV